jgi:hypothetical protein
MTKEQNKGAALSAAELQLLKRFGPETYTIEMPATAARRRLEADGLIAWRGGLYGTMQYALTDAGRAALSSEPR